MDTTTKDSSKDTWYYIIVQNPGDGVADLVGFEDTENKKTFIPVFATKEEAQQCFLIMPKDIMKNKYEVQAIIQEDVFAYADRQGFGVYLLDDRSTIKAKLI